MTDLPYHNLYMSLYSAVDTGILEPSPNASRKWMRWIDRKYLDAGTEYFGKDDDITHDVVGTALLLKTFEGNTPGEMQFDEEEMQDIVHAFLIGMTMEQLCRDGFLESLDELSVWDDEGSWKMTEEGKLEADLMRSIPPNISVSGREA